MKKTFKPCFTILLLSAAALLFSACGSQMERDADKMAKRAVEFRHTQERFADRSNMHGKPMSREELEEYSKEYIDYATKMLEKYDETPEMKREFYQLVEKKISEME